VDLETVGGDIERSRRSDVVFRQEGTETFAVIAGAVAGSAKIIDLGGEFLQGSKRLREMVQAARRGIHCQSLNTVAEVNKEQIRCAADQESGCYVRRRCWR
jgi:hypothetical protein